MAIPPIAAVSHGPSGELSSTARFAQSPASMSHDNFIAIFGNIVEGAPWIAETVWQQGLSNNDDIIAKFHQRLVAVFCAADDNQQNEVIHNHPELAAPRARAAAITAQSQHEQKQAGLDSLSSAAAKSLMALNREYRQKFGFPFILAIGELHRDDILRAIRTRLKNHPEAERRRALTEICTIAWLRLRRL